MLCDVRGRPGEVELTEIRHRWQSDQPKAALVVIRGEQQDGIDLGVVEYIAVEGNDYDGAEAFEQELADGLRVVRVEQLSWQHEPKSSAVRGKKGGRVNDEVGP